MALFDKYFYKNYELICRPYRCPKRLSLDMEGARAKLAIECGGTPSITTVFVPSFYFLQL